MADKTFALSEFDKLLSLLLYFEGYVSDDGQDVDFSKINRKKFTRTQIILHSIAIFSQKGVVDTTVQDLLEAAQVSRRTFYKYFKDKFDVLESIYALSINMLSRRFVEELKLSDSLDDLVNRTVTLYFGYHTSMGSMIRIVHEEACRQESPLNKRRTADREAFVKTFSAHVQKYAPDAVEAMPYYSIFWTMENASLYLLTETECTIADIESCKSAMTNIILGILDS
jgi:AcrR family transcriptional regulator